MVMCDVNDDAGMKEHSKRVSEMEASLHKLEQVENRFAIEQEASLAQYRELTAQAAEMDADALAKERLSIRPDMMQEGRTQLRNAYGKRYDGELAQQAEQDVRGLLGEKDFCQMTIRERLEWARREIVKQELPKAGKERGEIER